MIFLTVFLLFSADILAAQESNQAIYLQKYQNVLQLYNTSHWHEAAIEFRRAQEISATVGDWSRAIYWVILSELAYSDYGSALLDMDELDKIAPNSSYSRDMLYHRARVYFNLGYFDDALLLFRRYIDAVSTFETNLDEFADRIAAAYFWIGECLYTMGQFDEAQKFYTWVIDRYPESPKQEVCIYRVELIKQKKIEAELLALLQWSHEESLRTSEDYQRRIRVYEYTLNEYQRRLAEITSGQSRTGTPVTVVPLDIIPADIQEDDDPQSAYQRLLEWARQLIMVLDQMIIEREYGGSF